MTSQVSTGHPGWSGIVAVMTRPQPVTLPMVALFAIVPFYLYIGSLVEGRILHAPELALDRALPVEPAWSLVYGSLFLAALLPVFVVHQQELVRRTINAFLAIWLFSYACFLVYPTIGARPEEHAGAGFADWGLRLIYSVDHQYNCFPSLHVAQCFLAALACYRVHRGVGAVACVWAFLVGVSTLYTKQHYVLDAIAGAVIGYVAYAVFLRSCPRETVPELERRLAPVLALGAVGVYALFVGIFWILYLMGVEP
jgi:membrane-associated phospholipid phosphatase